MKADKNRIYQTIIDLEGPRHPILNMDHLNYTADYIVTELQALGIHVEVQNFEVKGFDGIFKNIIASTGEINDKTIMLSSHYDTVQFCPGANDNLSAVAVLLETARIIRAMEKPLNVAYVFFTLEEGNPAIKQAMNERLRDAGIINQNLKYNSLDLLKASKTLFRKSKPLYSKLYSPVQVYETLMNTDLSASELKLATVYLETYKKFPETDENTLPVIGSSYYVNCLDTNIRCLVNFDCIGWIKKEKGTQKSLPIPDDFIKSFEMVNMNPDDMMGNYLGVAGDINSSSYLKTYANCMKDIPHLAMDVPLNHNQMKQLVPDLLRSDHRPFWKRNIPALFITDLANFRSELYHTPADQSQHLDYDILEKITDATLKFLLDTNS